MGGVSISRGVAVPSKKVRDAHFDAIPKVVVRRFGAPGIAPEEQKVEGKKPSRTATPVVKYGKKLALSHFP